MKDLFISLAFGIILASACSVEVYHPEPVMPLDSRISHDIQNSLHKYIGSPIIPQVSKITMSSDYERNATPCPMILGLITNCISPFKDEVRASTKQAEVCENSLLSEADDVSNSTTYVRASDIPDIMNVNLKPYNLELNDAQKQKIQSDFSPIVKKNTNIRRSKCRDFSNLCLGENKELSDK